MRDGVRVAGDAQAADENRRRQRPTVRLGEQAREALERAKPERAVAVAESKPLEVFRQPVSRGVVFSDLAGRRIESVQTTAGAQVDTPRAVLGDTINLVA